jgi:NAD(P)-dependent dehydrogenase (short-subunit alcohol dehydrogenase family)
MPRGVGVGFGRHHPGDHSCGSFAQIFCDVAVGHHVSGWNRIDHIKDSPFERRQALSGARRWVEESRRTGGHGPSLAENAYAAVSSPLMDIRLDGTVALVTGGSKGIGKAIAAAFSAAGAQVLISSRKADALESAANEINAAGGGHVSWSVANAGDGGQASACVDQCMQTYGRVDILVNNAATNPYMGPMLDIDAGRAAKTVEVNQYGYITWARLVRDAWMKEHGGAILNVASIGGLSVDGGIGYYNVTKAAVLHMTRNMAAEVAPNIRVNSISPGLVKTDMARALWEEHEATIAKRMPLHRLGEPEDIANAALFLCSDAASWITGVNLVVDGGALLGMGGI